MSVRLTGADEETLGKMMRGVDKPQGVKLCSEAGWCEGGCQERREGRKEVAMCMK